MLIAALILALPSQNSPPNDDNIHVVPDGGHKKLAWFGAATAASVAAYALYKKRRDIWTRFNNGKGNIFGSASKAGHGLDSAAHDPAAANVARDVAHDAAAAHVHG
eukprot:NODE_333_length_10741_cov_0.423135.p8 type:complete len:106 gc:universal NODE_333_length_10741_cov_0.423135:1462-1779(+)